MRLNKTGILIFEAPETDAVLAERYRNEKSDTFWVIEGRWLSSSKEDFDTGELLLKPTHVYYKGYGTFGNIKKGAKKYFRQEDAELALKEFLHRCTIEKAFSYVPVHNPRVCDG